MLLKKKKLSPVIVTNKTCWTPEDHIKVMFSFLFERISKKYESCKYSLPGVGYKPLVEPYSWSI
jgi:hypothetical protein